MNRHPIEVYLSGHTWVAHRDDDHDCADDTAPHGTADTETGAVRSLIRAEVAS